MPFIVRWTPRSLLEGETSGHGGAKGRWLIWDCQQVPGGWQDDMPKERNASLGRRSTASMLSDNSLILSLLYNSNQDLLLLP